MNKVQIAVRRLQEALHNEVKDLGRSDYREVLERMHSELEGRMEGLDEEEEAEAAVEGAEGGENA